uniref:Polyprotein n=1 Tax=Echinococcus granulosus TaxID=6210 RepID=U6FVH7_ECHGR|nr:hypothetical protein EgrG_002066500 [Echinococcus granulosus]
MDHRIRHATWEGVKSINGFSDDVARVSLGNAIYEALVTNQVPSEMGVHRHMNAMVSVRMDTDRYVDPLMMCHVTRRMGLDPVIKCPVARGQTLVDRVTWT